METYYESHDNKLLAFIKAFKIWRYYLKNYKYELFIFTNNNNLRHLIDIKNLSLKKV